MGPLLRPEHVNESQQGGAEWADIMNQTEPSGSAASRYPACHSALWRGAPRAVGSAD